jgi:hypothetical protein
MKSPAIRTPVPSAAAVKEGLIKPAKRSWKALVCQHLYVRKTVVKSVQQQSEELGLCKSV